MADFNLLFDLWQELRNLATFLTADGCDYLTGEIIAIDGGAFRRWRWKLLAALTSRGPGL